MLEQIIESQGETFEIIDNYGIQQIRVLSGHTFEVL